MDYCDEYQSSIKEESQVITKEGAEVAPQQRR